MKKIEIELCLEIFNNKIIKSIKLEFDLEKIKKVIYKDKEFTLYYDIENKREIFFIFSKIPKILKKTEDWNLMNYDGFEKITFEELANASYYINDFDKILNELKEKYKEKKMIIDEIREKIKFQKNILIVGNDSGKLKEIYNKVLKIIKEEKKDYSHGEFLNNNLERKEKFINFFNKNTENCYLTLLKLKEELPREYKELKIEDFFKQEFKENRNIADTFLNFDCLYILGNGYSYLKS